MTREELVQQAKRQLMYAQRMMLPLLPMFGLIMMPAFIGPEHWNKSLSIVLLCVLGALGVLSIVGALQAKRRQLECPACKRPLQSALLTAAIASGRCGSCGSVIAEDWNK